MSNSPDMIVDRAVFAQVRSELGTGFQRILGYFREDGVKSVQAIEQAMRVGNAAALILPAHTLKGESLQFGAEPLGALAELIETTARRCVERHETPNELIGDVVRLRPLFEETLAFFDSELAAAPPARAGFGRKVVIQPSFGRL